MIQVTRAKFYAFMGPRDVVLSSYAHETLWKTRDGKLLGKTSGYLRADSENQYWLKEEI